MERDEIKKRYLAVQRWLAIIAPAVMMLNLFIPAFIGKVMGQTFATERGIDFISGMIKYVNNDGSIFIDGLFWVFMMTSFVFLGFIVLPIGFIINAILLKKMPLQKALNQGGQIIGECFGFSIAYYVFCMIHVCVNNGGFKLLARNGVRTGAHWVLILEIAIFIISIYMKNHMNKALAGKVQPFEFGGVKLTFNSNSSQSNQTETSSAPSTATQMSKAEENTEAVSGAKVEENAAAGSSSDTKSEPVSNDDGSKYQVIYKSYGTRTNLMYVCKILNEDFGYKIKDALALAENTPAVLMDNLSYQKAVEIKEKFEDCGAEIELKKM